MGRSIAIWIVGAAATVTAGGLMLPSTSTDDKSSVPSKSNSDIVEYSAAPSGGSVAAPDQPIEIQIPAWEKNPPDRSEVLEQIAVSDGNVRNSRSGDLPPIEAETNAAEIEAPIEIAPPAPTAGAPTEIAPVASLPSVKAPTPDRSKVELFYATDRAAILPWSMGYWLPSFISAAVALIGTSLAFLAFVQWKQRFLWGLAVIGGLALCGIVTSKAVLRYNTASRLVAMGGVIFGGDRNDTELESIMNYGRALVTLPANHKVGQVERPNTLLFEYKETPDKHVMVRQMQPLNEADFFSSVDQSVQGSKEQAVLVFIHGYNVSFQDALLRTAQLACDLRFDGVPMTYSWPSTARLTGYLTDEENVERSVTHLEDLLHNIKTKTNTKQLHVIVHSMGNRALMGAVERLTLRYPTMQPMLGQVVLAAPDVDVGQFESRYLVPIHQAAKQVTLYTSSQDQALRASMAIHKVERLGFTSPSMRTYRGIDTVDVSKIDTSLLGHSYYGSQENLIKDIRALIELGEPPLQRQWLKEVTGQVEPALWRFADSLNLDSTGTAR
jgi:esterase/lipase superfamily enzyme